MYLQAERELTTLLTRQKYPALLGVKEYNDLMVGGALDAARSRQAAATIVGRLAKSGGVHEFGSRQAVAAKVWTGELYRALGPRSNPFGEWWFDGEVVKRWERNYASLPAVQRKDKILEALRPMLAVCYDWNDFTKLVVMRPGTPGIPVLTGQGTPQPIHSNRSPNHDPQEKVIFIGGYQQVFVPFVPQPLVSPYL